MSNNDNGLHSILLKGLMMNCTNSYNKVEIRAGKKVRYYVPLGLGGAIFIFTVIALIFAPNQHPINLKDILTLLVISSGFPLLCSILSTFLRITVTDEELSWWEIDLISPANSIRIMDIKQVVEDRRGSSGTLYAAAPFHALIIFPLASVSDSELVINLKPYEEGDDLARLFTALRERGVRVEAFADNVKRKRSN